MVEHLQHAPRVDAFTRVRCFNLSPIAHVLVDDGGIIRDANAAFAVMFERVLLPLGKPFFTVIPLERTDLVWELLHACRDDKRGASCDIDLVLPSGRRRTVQALATPYLDDSCGAVGALVALIDVDARARAECAQRRAHESELRLRAQMELLSAAHAAVADAADDAVARGAIVPLLEEIVAQARLLVDGDGAAVDLDGETRARSADHGGGEPRATVELSLRKSGRVMGALVVEKCGGFADGDRRLLHLLADAAASAIDRVRCAETERRRRSWLQAVIDKMPDAVFLADADGGVVVNEAAAAWRVSGDVADPRFDVRTADGAPLADRDHPLTQALRGETVDGGMLIFTLRDGEQVRARAKAVPVVDVDGTRMGAVCLCRDFTAVHRLERQRQEWAAVIAHDMRQPLSAIRIYDELLAKSTASRADETAAHAVDRIRVAALRMWTMTEELLDTSLLDSDRLAVVKAPCCVAACVREMIEQLRGALAGRQVSVRAPCDDDTVVPADEGRIEQIVGNLLSNACKYGAPGAAIDVRVDVYDAAIAVSIASRGRTIPEAELAQLFSRFFRTDDARKSSARGLGLGLYVVRGLVEAHGGTIRARSVDGVTTITFTLPRGPALTST